MAFELIYCFQIEKKTSDPVLAMEGEEIWSPVCIELWCGDTICAFYKDDKRMIYPDRMKEFRVFQRMFARNIREQGWVENERMVEKSSRLRP